MKAGLMIAAPQSGSGKTVMTLGLLRALRDRGVAIAPAKAGPDYIDPAFHEAASGAVCVNLDPWAMREKLLQRLAAGQQAQGGLIVEAMMGLFDGAADGTGSAADLAAALQLPVLLVVDAGRLSHSVAALVGGYRDFRCDVRLAGVILNRVGSERHELMLREALARIDVPVFGAVRRDASLELPSRHLGLVQAGETDDLEAFIQRAAELVADGCDVEALTGLLDGDALEDVAAAPLPPPGQRIAVARDTAFAFLYPHLLNGWREAVAEISFFSPLEDESPERSCDAVYLPGGYPELYAGRLAANGTFLGGLREAAARGAFVYGECGGFMVLGDAIIDADGVRHTMAGLLRLVTTFETSRLHLGYRVLKPLAELPFVSDGATLTGHEFHHTSVVEMEGNPLFAAEDARGNDLGCTGLIAGNVAGSYCHLIDRCA